MAFLIPDPSSLTPLHSQSYALGPEKEGKDKVHEAEEYISTPVFVYTKLQDHDLSPSNIVQTKKAMLQYFSSSSFMRRKRGKKPANQLDMGQTNVKDKEILDLFVIPYKNKGDSPGA